MALTAEGAALTREHQAQQVVQATTALAQSKLLWPTLGRSPNAWLALQLMLLRQHYTASQDLASAYLAAYRGAEGVKEYGIERSLFPESEMASVLLAGGVNKVTNLLEAGATPDEAMKQAFKSFGGLAFRQALMGGRELIADTTATDRQAIGWRRVTGAKPCTFCAMLAARGPEYRSRKSASEVGGTSLRYHRHCKCTSEIVYGQWQPTKREAEFIAQYEAARAQFPKGQWTEDNILPLMRQQGDFRDSPLVRNKPNLPSSE